MKTLLYYFSVLPALLLLISCGGNEPEQNMDSLDALKSKKTALLKSREEIEAQIKTIEEKIALQDTEVREKLVSAEKIVPRLLEHQLELVGNIETKANVLIYPEASGIVEQLYVTAGTRVKKGQVLAKLATNGLEEQLAQLDVQLALLETTFQRQKRLWEVHKIGSEIQFLQSKAQYESQIEAKKQLQVALSKTEIIAPFSGIIDEVLKEKGNLVSPGPGSEMFRIINLSSMYIAVDIPEKHLSTIQKGKKVDISIPTLGKEISSSVRQVGNFIQPSNRTFTVEIAVPNSQGDLKPNLTANVFITDYINTEALLVPRSVVSENAQGELTLYIATPDGKGNNIATKKTVTTGYIQGDEIEITSGLKSEDLVIVEGARIIKEGQYIQLIKAS